MGALGASQVQREDKEYWITESLTQ